MLVKNASRIHLGTILREENEQDRRRGATANQDAGKEQEANNRTHNIGLSLLNEEGGKLAVGSRGSKQNNIMYSNKKKAKGMHVCLDRCPRE